MDNAHQVGAAHDVKIDHVKNAGEPSFKVVKVLAEGGILKNGVHYAKGDEATITTSAAEGFAAISEVEILGDAKEQADA